MTAAGEAMLVRGQRILEDLQSLENDVRRMGQGLRGTLRIGFTGSATYGIMPRVVRDSARAFDAVALEVRGELLTPELTQQLLEHRIDIAVLRPPVPSPDIEVRSVARERMCVALPIASRLAGRGAISFDDLVGHPLVGYPEGSSVSGAIGAECVRRGIAFNYGQRVSETSTLLSLVAAGIGGAIVPESATALGLAGIEFCEIVDAPTIELAVAWRRGDTLPLLHRFLPYLTEVITAYQGSTS